MGVEILERDCSSGCVIQTKASENSLQGETKCDRGA